MVSRSYPSRRTDGKKSRSPHASALSASSFDLVNKSLLLCNYMYTLQAPAQNCIIIVVTASAQAVGSASSLTLRIGGVISLRYYCKYNLNITDTLVSLFYKWLRESVSNKFNSIIIPWLFENRILRRVFGLKRNENGEWGMLHNEELHSLYRSPNIIRVIRSRR